MAKVSLKDLRAGDAKVALAERSYSLCLRRDLVAKVDRLTDALSTAQVNQASVDPDAAPPKRKGQGPDAEVKRIRAELSALRDELEDNTGELRLRAISDGEWRRFVNEHPARDGNDRDETLAFGICNGDDLVDSLARWAHAWEGEPLAADDWERIFAPNAAGGDLRSLAQIVVQMQEVADDPKGRLFVLLGAPMSNADVFSPEQ